MRVWLTVGLVGFLAAVCACQNIGRPGMSGAPVYNVRSFGAKGNGQTLDSPAIDRAD